MAIAGPPEVSRGAGLIWPRATLGSSRLSATVRAPDSSVRRTCPPAGKERRPLASLEDPLFKVGGAGVVFFFFFFFCRKPRGGTRAALKESVLQRPGVVTTLLGLCPVQPHTKSQAPQAEQCPGPS